MLSFIARAVTAAKRVAGLKEEIADTKVLLGRLLVAQMRGQMRRGEPVSFNESEFKVFSQFGDDGLIQYLLHRIPIGKDERRFIEFGVETYEEANTRFLMVNDNWSGLVMDSAESNVRHIRNDPLFWRHDLTAVRAFISAENIDPLIAEAGFAGAIGLLSIDIDGNDYWVWERIACTQPVIVVVEYNGVFGAEHAVSVPYDATFDRTAAHHSSLYWGCSIAALAALAQKKGYALVGSNSAGNNAYFVRRDRLAGLAALDPAAAYVESKYRESRDEAGRLTYLSGRRRLQAIRDLPLHEVRSGRTVRIGELYAL